MTERRYYDLFAEISRMTMPHNERMGVATALHWLDEHPDQVPGRTITLADSLAETEVFTPAARYAWVRGFEAAGGRIIPEPTNAEKLAEAITNAAHGVGIGSTTANIKAIAEHLDDAGVKAPGGDK